MVKQEIRKLKSTRKELSNLVKTTSPHLSEKEVNTTVETLLKKRTEHGKILVTCDECGRKMLEHDGLNERGRIVVRVEYPGYMACRLRTDGTIGYQCICGNDTRVSPEEQKIMGSDLLIRRPNITEIAKIVKITKPKKVKKVEFIEEKVKV